MLKSRAHWTRVGHFNRRRQGARQKWRRVLGQKHGEQPRVGFICHVRRTYANAPFICVIER